MIISIAGAMSVELKLTTSKPAQFYLRAARHHPLTSRWGLAKGPRNFACFAPLCAEASRQHASSAFCCRRMHPAAAQRQRQDEALKICNANGVSTESVMLVSPRPPTK